MVKAIMILMILSAVKFIDKEIKSYVRYKICQELYAVENKQLKRQVRGHRTLSDDFMF
jgi:hypothetical protein